MLRKIRIALFATLCLQNGLTKAAIINVGPGESIQAAIDAAINGDEILVAPGNYFQLINFMGKAITVRSSGGPAVTVIFGFFAGPTVKCISGEGPGTVLEGLTIAGGASLQGGGMRIINSSPTIVDCVFGGNESKGAEGGRGGGMFNDNSSPSVTGCTFMGNNANEGGGIYNLNGSSPQITDSVFTENTGGNAVVTHVP